MLDGDGLGTDAVEPNNTTRCETHVSDTHDSDTDLRAYVLWSWLLYAAMGNVAEEACFEKGTEVQKGIRLTRKGAGR